MNVLTATTRHRRGAAVTRSLLTALMAVSGLVAVQNPAAAGVPGSAGVSTGALGAPDEHGHRAATAADLAASIATARNDPNPSGRAGTARLASAARSPETPDFGRAIDAYASYDGQDTCDRTVKPGTIGLRDLLNTAYGQHTAYFLRNCDEGDQSEHKEGRALDYMLNINNSAERATAADILNWLLATDQYGNRHANARRLGIMYMIWNRQIWKSYESGKGWQPYGCDGTPGGCHTNHIHFSLSWKGALKQTSWWTTSQSVVWPRSGAPAVYNPQTQNLQVYFRTVSSTLQERYWDGAWHGGPIPGAPPITEGKPVAVYNPASKNVSVFYNSNGHLAEMYYETATGRWLRGVSVGDRQMTGSPAVVFNPGQQTVEVYYNAGGVLAETWWKDGTWRTGSVGGPISGSPSVLHNGKNGNIEVYFGRTGASGAVTLAQYYWNATKGWSGGSLGAPMDPGTSPSAIWDPAFANAEVYYRNNGTLHQKYWQSSDGAWSNPSPLPGRITEGDPFALFNPENDNVEVYYNTDGKLTETYHTRTGWSSADRPGGAGATEKMIGTPFAVHNGRNGNAEVYFNNGGALAEYYHNGRQWSPLGTLGGSLS